MQPSSILGGRVSRNVQELVSESFVENGFSNQGLGEREKRWVVYLSICSVVALRTTDGGVVVTCKLVSNLDDGRQPLQTFVRQKDLSK
jgi:hypothetical protein